MSRQKENAQNRQLKSDLPATRRAVTAAVELLSQKLRIPQKAVAEATGWNAGYLSEFLRPDREPEAEGEAIPPRKVPTPAKVESLVQALLDMCTDHQARIGPDRAEVESGLLEVAERYGFRWQPRAPAAGIIPPQAPNFVSRRCEEEVRAYLPGAGVFLIDGPPLSGKSTLAGLVAHEAETAGRKVILTDCSRRLYSHGGYGDTEILAKLIETVTGAPADSERARYELQMEFDSWVDGAPLGATIVLDNVNQGPDKAETIVRGIIKEWAFRTSSALPTDRAYRRFSAWVVMTSQVAQVQAMSAHRFPTGRHVISRWFDEKPDVYDLARRLSPVRTTPARDQWVDEVHKYAYSYFRGQPHLTHLFIEACAQGLQKPTEAPLPTGAFAVHLDHLATLLLTTSADAQAAVEGGERVEALDWSPELEALGLLTYDRRWSCRWYSEHLPGAFVKRRTLMLERRGGN